MGRTACRAEERGDSERRSAQATDRSSAKPSRTIPRLHSKKLLRKSWHSSGSCSWCSLRHSCGDLGGSDLRTQSLRMMHCASASRIPLQLICGFAQPSCCGGEGARRTGEPRHHSEKLVHQQLYSGSYSAPYPFQVPIEDAHRIITAACTATGSLHVLRRPLAFVIASIARAAVRVHDAPHTRSARRARPGRSRVPAGTRLERCQEVGGERRRGQPGEATTRLRQHPQGRRELSG